MKVARRQCYVQTFRQSMSLLCGVSAAALASTALAADPQSPTPTPPQAGPNAAPLQAVSAASVAAADNAPSETKSSGIGEVVVTARRVKESIQKVPIAVTAVNKEAIVEQAVVDPTHVQFVAPSVQSSTTYDRLVGGYAIRGITGSGTYFAEVPGGPTSIPSAPLYDMDSIQVLNGPQGTLFGRTNISGAALFEPTRPQFNHLDGFFTAAEGNLGMNHDSGAINIPVIDDQLAIRIAADRYHLDGFTKVIGSDQSLNETNNYAARFSVNWRPGGGRFSDYAVLDYTGVSESSSGWVLSAYNPAIPEFHLPANIQAPGGLATGAGYFGAACNQAVVAGIQSSYNGCINQRLQIAATWLPALQSELARIQKGGNSALQETAGPYNAGVEPKEFLNQFFFVNQALYDFGDLGFTTLSIKNILGIDTGNGSSGWEIDGIGGSLFSALSGGGSGSFFYSNSGNQTTHLNQPATGYFSSSPYVSTYTDETQVRGVIGHNLLQWNVGFFYSDMPLPVENSGVQNIARTFGGIFQPSLGFQPSFSFQNGGSITEKAVYGQGTLDLSWAVPFIKALHLTGGWRDTWDDSKEDYLAPEENLTTGVYYTGSAQPPATTSSEGTNTTIALDAQITDNLLTYFTTRTAYVPGGVNSVIGAAGIFAGYTPTYAPESVTDYELGVKDDFHVGPAIARIDADIYELDFANIQEQLFASGTNSAGQTITAVFETNAAAARMRGLELQGQVIAGPVHGTLTYSYTNAEFTRWIGSDPLGLIGVGSSQCLPTSPAGECLLNLSHSKFPNIPANKLTAAITYTVPLSDKVGMVSLTASAAAQTRSYFTVQSTRNIEAFGPTLGVKQVEASQSQAPYALFNLRAEWRHVYGSQVTVSAFVNNLTNYNYAISSISVLQSLGTAVNLYGDPRTFGVELRYDFGQ